MPRRGRVVLPGCPHHIVQRGHNKNAVFVEQRDYVYYLNTLKEFKADFGIKVYAYCLIRNKGDRFILAGKYIKHGCNCVFSSFALSTMAVLLSYGYILKIINFLNREYVIVKSKSFLLVGLLCLTSWSHGWEGYKFDVRLIRTDNDHIRVYTENLGARESNDSNICDNPKEVRIEDTTKQKSQNMYSMVIAAKMASKRVWVQTLSQHSNNNGYCVVKAWQMGIEP